MIFCSLHFQRHALSPEEAAAWNAPDERNDFYNRPPPPFPALRSGQHLLCIVKEDKTRFVVSVISWRSVSGGKLVSVTMSRSGSGVSIVRRDRQPRAVTSTTAQQLPSSLIRRSSSFCGTDVRRCPSPKHNGGRRPFYCGFVSPLTPRLSSIVLLHFTTGFHSLWSMMSCSIYFNRSHFLKRLAL